MAAAAPVAESEDEPISCRRKGRNLDAGDWMILSIFHGGFRVFSCSPARNVCVRETERLKVDGERKKKKEMRSLGGNVDIVGVGASEMGEVGQVDV